MAKAVSITDGSEGAAGKRRGRRRTIRDLAKQVPGARAFVHFLDHIYHCKRYRIYRWQTSISAEAERHMNESGLRFREANASDIEQMRDMDTWRDWELYAQWLDAGKRLLVAVKDETIVSYSWLDFRPGFRLEQIPEVTLRLAPDSCYSDEAYTPPAYRGLGYRRYLFTYELHTARREGKRYIVSYFLFHQAAIDGLRNFERIGIPRGEHIMTVTERELFWRRFIRDRSISGQTTVDRVGR